MVGIGPRFGSGRTSVWSEARHGYVGGGHLLCWPRASTMSAARRGYVGRAHLCIKAVGLIVIAMIIVNHKKRLSAL